MEQVFQRLATNLNASDVESLGACFEFKFQDEDAWYLDARGPAVTIGRAPAPFDCSCELSQAAFQRLIEGRVSPQKLFFDGELQLKGDLSLVRRLSMLAKAYK